MGVRLSTVKDSEYSKEPYLIISGKCLADAGFKSGSKFIVEISGKGEIILKLVEEEF
jgi:hypothetical protein